MVTDDTRIDGAGPQPVLPQGHCGACYVSGIGSTRGDGGYGPADAAD